MIKNLITRITNIFSKSEKVESPEFNTVLTKEYKIKKDDKWNEDNIKIIEDIKSKCKGLIYRNILDLNFDDKSGTYKVYGKYINGTEYQYENPYDAYVFFNILENYHAIFTPIIDDQYNNSKFYINTRNQFYINGIIEVIEYNSINKYNDLLKFIENNITQEVLDNNNITLIKLIYEKSDLIFKVIYTNGFAEIKDNIYDTSDIMYFLNELIEYKPSVLSDDLNKSLLLNLSNEEIKQFEEEQTK